MLALVGKSGSGKTTIEDELIHKYGFKRAISYTTRKKRENDVEGVNYFFVSREDIERLKQEDRLGECITYIDDIYALDKEQCKADRVVVVAPEGLKQLKEKKDLYVISIYLDVSKEVRKERMLNRGDSLENVEKRLEKDDVLFDGAESMVDVVLDTNNKSIDRVVGEVLEIYG